MDLENTEAKNNYKTKTDYNNENTRSLILNAIKKINDFLKKMT